MVIIRSSFCLLTMRSKSVFHRKSYFDMLPTEINDRLLRFYLSSYEALVLANMFISIANTLRRYTKWASQFYCTDFFGFAFQKHFELHLPKLVKSHYFGNLDMTLSEEEFCSKLSFHNALISGDPLLVANFDRFKSNMSSDIRIIVGDKELAINNNGLFTLFLTGLPVIVKSVRYNFVDDSELRVLNLMVKRQGGHIEKISLSAVDSAGDLFDLLENKIDYCQINTLFVEKVMSPKEWKVLSRFSPSAFKWRFFEIDEQPLEAQETLASITKKWLKQFPEDERPKCDRDGKVLGGFWNM